MKVNKGFNLHVGKKEHSPFCWISVEKLSQAKILIDLFGIPNACLIDDFVKTFGEYLNENVLDI